MSKQEMQALVKRLFMIHAMNSLPPVPVLAYILVIALDRPVLDVLKVMAVILPFNMLLVGNAIPWLVISGALSNAFAHQPGDGPADKLTRILKIPRQIEYKMFFVYVCSGTTIVGGMAWYFQRQAGSVQDFKNVPMSVVGFVLVILLMFIRQGIGFEEALRPYAIREFHHTPQLKLQGSGMLWTRQAWYLPYTFALFVLCTLVVVGLIIGRKYRDGMGQVLAELSDVPAKAAKVSALMMDLSTSVLVPLVLVGGFMLVVSAWAAWSLTKNQKDGMRAVEESIRSIASTKPALPNWVGSDEIGDLSIATASVFEQLRVFSVSLRESASRLGSSAAQLGASNLKQNEILTLQAAALQETQVTAQEIKQTSLLATQKAEGVLEVTVRADEISRAGEGAVERSLTSLQSIREQVTGMADRIKQLDEQARQIANITTTVKDLADQSNMLALNAAIEAVRAGENGRGFGVVAREIRSLADQSIRSTQHVREILHDISNAISGTVAMTEAGTQKIDQSLDQIRSFGELISQMSSIIRENGQSVRQISAAVTQQNAGISEIFKAVQDLSNMMDQAVGRLRDSDNTADLVRQVAEQVNGFVGRFGSENPSAATENKPRA